ncbi:MAG: tripartite tricarboxylate transporter substrate binding protein [Deltaproteobacteria bacterium]|jgi:tripartite-type tricarboxylate transporter receptor subunit TctC|nr:tripartite tricarboxylate transporter substrate binding protein [Deltaproteobacteria bacterium]
MTTRKKWFGWAVVFFMVLSMTAVPDMASAAYPEKVINWIIPWAAGGRTDVAARILAPALEKELGKPVIVVNKPGAGGVVGSKEVASAKPDGYTMMLTSISLILTQYTAPTPTNLKDYTLACQLLTSPALLTVNSKAPWHGVRDFIEYAKVNPNKIKNGASGTGTSDHIFAAAFQQKAGIKMTHVPYTGDAPAVAAVVGKHIDSNFAPMPSVKQFVDAGELKILGVGSNKRRALYPNVPTWKEQGLDLSISAFQGIYLPKNTPKEIVATLERVFEKVLKDPEIVSKIEKVGIELEFLPQGEFTALVEETDSTLKVLVDQLGLKAK